MAAISMLDSTFEADKLTSEIFSILENKFLFGYDNKLPSTNQNQTLCLEEMKSGEHITGKVRILSIDGAGATDGILAAKSLACLEASLRHKSGNPEARIASYFDVVAGSGVGGVLAALLFTRGKDGGPSFTADQALKYVIENGPIISRPSRRGVFKRALGTPAKASKLFRKTFGELTLKDTLKAVLIPCYDLTTGSPFVFSRADALEYDGYNFKISDVCAATAEMTAQTETVSVDGGTKITALGGAVAMNNPTAAAITHVMNNKHEFPFCNGVDDLLVVSLGNGEPYCGAGSQIPSRGAFVKIVGDGVSEMVDQAVSMAFGQSRADNYIRIQANGSVSERQNWSEKDKAKIDILTIVEDMLAQKNVESVLFQGKKLNHTTNLDKLDFSSMALIKENRRRKTCILPTVVLKSTNTTTSPRTSSATTLSISSN